MFSIGISNPNRKLAYISEFFCVTFSHFETVKERRFVASIWATPASNVTLCARDIAGLVGREE
jgi:hypothetical protein